jgi:hypothetical protein
MYNAVSADRQHNEHMHVVCHRRGTFEAVSMKKSSFIIIWSACFMNAKAESSVKTGLLGANIKLRTRKDNGTFSGT